MNRKRIFTVFMAVAIAGMLIALPYESNAVIGAIVVGIIAAGALIGFGAWIGYHYAKNANDNVQYVHDTATYMANWKAKLEDIDNQIKQAKSYAYNTMDIFNTTKLYYIRYGERVALEHLDKNNWSEVEPYCLELFENDTKAIYLSILEQFIIPLHELYTECKGIYLLSLSDTEYAKFILHDTGGDTFIWFEDGAYYCDAWSIALGMPTETYANVKNYIYNETYTLYEINTTKLKYYGDWNTSSISTILAKPIYFLVDGTHTSDGQFTNLVYIFFVNN
ncbi:MAG: hypothetical protein DRN29_05865, partial [Thermoplasmata archaeon]